MRIFLLPPIASAYRLGDLFSWVRRRSIYIHSRGVYPGLDHSQDIIMIPYLILLVHSAYRMCSWHDSPKP